MAEEVKNAVEEVVEETEKEATTTGKCELEVEEDLEAEATAEEVTEEDSDEKKGIFKKKKHKKDEQIEELTDKLKRQMAEFDNFRKRTEKEKAQMYEIGAREIIEKILPVVDNFERGMASVAEEDKSNSFYEGIDMIYKQLISTLEGAGVKVIETKNAAFDPNFHNAVMHIEDEELEENVVVEEFQKGYVYKDCVVRHSMVKVAN